jgi:hypothetical protein
MVVHTSKGQGATSRALGSPLFSAASSQQQQQPGKQPLQSLFRRVMRSRLGLPTKALHVVTKKFRRSLTLALTVSFLWLGAASFSTLPSHASTAAPSNPVIERLTQAYSPTLDTMVDKYVKQHMFDDDVYDPVESMYKEANDDAVSGKYPVALREIAQGALGDGGKMSRGDRDGGDSNTAGANVANMLTGAIAALEKRTGLSQQAAIIVLASFFVVAGPMMGLFGMMMIGGVSKRNMNKVMKQRYGDTYTVDATQKPEEDVEAPDDEDDDDDDDDDLFPFPFPFPFPVLFPHTL